jgi:hypothetical protein
MDFPLKEVDDTIPPPSSEPIPRIGASVRFSHPSERRFLLFFPMLLFVPASLAPGTTLLHLDVSAVFEILSISSMEAQGIHLPSESLCAPEHPMS